MPEHIRALVVILGLSIPMFLIAHKPALALGMADENFKRRRNVWLAATFIAFVASDFWVFAISMALLLAFSRRRGRNPLAIDFFLLFAVAAALKAPIAAFELVKQWSLYGSLPSALGIRQDDRNRMGRGDSLGAVAASTHSFVLGHVTMVAMLLAAVRRSRSTSGPTASPPDIRVASSHG